MKYLVLTITLILGMCKSQGETFEQALNTTVSERVLIVYLSRTENTAAVAKLIQEKVGGDLVALELEQPYPQNYQEIVSQVAEENETGFLPELKTEISDLDTYDTIFIGFPTWGMQLPPPMKSFLSRNDFSGKTLIPFNTNAGYGLGSSIETIHEICLDSEIAEAFSVKGGIERDGIFFVIKGEKAIQVEKKLDDWLATINF